MAAAGTEAMAADTAAVITDRKHLNEASHERPQAARFVLGMRAKKQSTPREGGCTDWPHTIHAHMIGA
jgi:hypothetical protein